MPAYTIRSHVRVLDGFFLCALQSSNAAWGSGLGGSGLGWAISSIGLARNTGPAAATSSAGARANGIPAEQTSLPAVPDRLGAAHQAPLQAMAGDSRPGNDLSAGQIFILALHAIARHNN